MTTSTITPEERALRQEAVDYGRDSVGLEGFTLSPAVEALNARYVAGELTSDELTAAIKEAVG